MTIALFSCDDLLKILISGVAPAHEETVNVCTVVEQVELIERIKKWVNFPVSMNKFVTDWPQVRGCCFVGELDAYRLERSLFLRTGYHLVEGFWPPGVAAGVSPGKRVRRLILRPDDSSWIGLEVFTEAESRFH